MSRIWDTFLADARGRARGLIHAGAHHGQEYPLYRAAGIANLILVEPLPACFRELHRRLAGSGARLLNLALGAAPGVLPMHVDRENAGMSSSLLRPAGHRDQYPGITFPTTELVRVERLDDVPFPRADYNCLVMDVQGYELEVLRGAPRTLPHLDFVLAEVNRAELYEGCARVEQLDDHLRGFGLHRWAVEWAGGTWGDAYYARWPPSATLLVGAGAGPGGW